jgi:hypothetical protein
MRAVTKVLFAIGAGLAVLAGPWVLIAPGPAREISERSEQGCGDDGALMPIDTAFVFGPGPPADCSRARSEPNSAACGSSLAVLWIPLRSVAPARGTWSAPLVAE